jgi:hypothetical protein
MGLLELSLISRVLRIDFYAAMYIGDITLRGQFDSSGNRLPDPDQRRRKSLKRLLENLVDAGILTRSKTIYANEFQIKNVDPTRVLENTPAEGIICWGDFIYVRNRPLGKREETYALSLPERKSSVDIAMAGILGEAGVDSAVQENCLRELKSVNKSLLVLLRKNGIEVERTNATRLQGIITATPDSPITIRLAHILGCFERPRLAARLLDTALRLAAIGIN